jgi:hypothetical protein
MSERIKTTLNKSMKSKYRFVILNDATFEEMFSLILSKTNLWIFLSTVVVILVIITSSAIIYTPLKYFIPGFGDYNYKNQIIELTLQTDSLEKALNAKSLKDRNFIKIITDSGLVDKTDQLIENSIIVPDQNAKIRGSSKEEMELRKEMSEVESFSINYKKEGKIDAASLLNEYYFMSPVKGVITDEFNAAGYTGFTADNVGSKVFELYKGQDFDSIDEIVNDIYRKTFDRAREMTKTGVTVLTGSSRFISGRGSNRYVDVAIKADSDTLIKDQMKAKNPTMSEAEINSLVSRVRQTEDKAKILIEVDNAGFLNFIQGNINLSPLIARANSNKEIMAIEKLISITVSDEDLANFTAKNKLMQDRQKMFKELQPGDLVELSINDGKNTVTLSVERLVPYANGKNNKVMFMPNSNNIKELIPTNSFSIVSVTKAGIKPSEVEVSPEANQNAKNNVDKMDDFTSEVERLKKLLERPWSDDNLFDGAEDPNNCNLINPE